MEELRVQHLARSAILVQASFPDFALHFGFHCVHRIIHSRPCDILHNLIARDCQVNAERLRNSKHESIANLPVAYGFAVFLTAHIHTRRQPFAIHRILTSQQCDKLCSPDRATKS
jgi:hypothetical protein